MAFDEQSTYYDLLEVAPDASPQEIRAAYLRAKSAYKKDSVALYTLMNEEETEDLIHRIEEAYQILSNVEKRREYDRHHGLLSVDTERLGSPRPPRNTKIVSIDRVPPMETGASEADILVAPTTDFTAGKSSGNDVFGSGEAPLPTFHTGQANPNRQQQQPSGPPIFQSDTLSSENSRIQPSFDPKPSTMVEAPLGPKPTANPGSSSHSQATASAASARAAEIAQEIEQEVEWRGPFLRKVRECKNVPLEELCDYTKISKNYILAIEEENYTKLPAPVFLRGFLIQIAKYLKLPHEKVATAYLARYNQARDDREKAKTR